MRTVCGILSVLCVAPTLQQDIGLEKWMIGSCVYENWDDALEVPDNISNVTDCLQTFLPVTNENASMLSPEKFDIGLVGFYLKEENEACPGLTNSSSNYTVHQTFLCYQDYVMVQLAASCLNSSVAKDATDILTDGAYCIIETLRNLTAVTSLVAAAPTDLPVHVEIAEETLVRLDEYIGQTLLPAAYCTVAWNTNNTEVDRCKSCFYNSSADDISSSNSSVDVYSCSQQFLLPYFKDCGLEKLKQDDVNMTDTAKQCLNKGVIRYVVGECRNSTGATGTSADDLTSTLKCGYQKAINMINATASVYVDEMQEYLADLLGVDPREVVEPAVIIIQTAINC